MGGRGGGSMNNLMKQAMKMQQEMEKAKEELAEKIVEASSGGAVKVTATCDKEIKSIEISQEVVDPDDVEMLQDLVLAAIKEVLRKADEENTAVMSRFTGGMGNIPGLF